MEQRQSNGSVNATSDQHIVLNNYNLIYLNELHYSS